MKMKTIHSHAISFFICIFLSLYVCCKTSSIEQVTENPTASLKPGQKTEENKGSNATQSPVEPQTADPSLSLKSSIADSANTIAASVLVENFELRETQSMEMTDQEKSKNKEVIAAIEDNNSNQTESLDVNETFQEQVMANQIEEYSNQTQSIEIPANNQSDELQMGIEDIQKPLLHSNSTELPLSSNSAVTTSGGERLESNRTDNSTGLNEVGNLHSDIESIETSKTSITEESKSAENECPALTETCGTKREREQLSTPTSLKTSVSRTAQSEDILPTLASKDRNTTDVKATEESIKPHIVKHEESRKSDIPFKKTHISAHILLRDL